VTAGPKPAKFYTDYCRWLDRGGLETIYYRPLTNDLSGFNAKGHALKTEAREAMIAANRIHAQSWVHELRTNVDSVLTTRGSLRTTSGSFFTTKELLRLFNDGS
jgi:hypothetical protein